MAVFIDLSPSLLSRRTARERCRTAFLVDSLSHAAAERRKEKGTGILSVPLLSVMFGSNTDRP